PAQQAKGGLDTSDAAYAKYVKYNTDNDLPVMSREEFNKPVKPTVSIGVRDVKIASGEDAGKDLTSFEPEKSVKGGSVRFP
ncbi:hypothetical protein ACI3PL_30420, partial [Lacticaseibacillus paracasei]